jgi:hypothetical protein
MRRRCALLAAVLVCASACGGSQASSSSSSKKSSSGAHPQDASVTHVASSARDAAALHGDAGALRDAGRGAADSGGDALHDGGGAHDAASADSGKPMPMCPPVTLTFAGTVATVANTPLGLTSAVRTAAVSGSFAYLPCVGDMDPDPQRGIYEHGSGGTFSLSVGGLTVAGSGTPRVEVENFDPDTIRWRDGAIPLDKRVRVMTVDGKPAPSVVVTIAITDDKGSALSSDALPTTFPFQMIASFPHTFSVEDAGGTLLLQLSSLTQK